jgi:hypothetical protein
MRADVIEEAIALEKAGGTWRQKHAAAITGYSQTYVRNSDCPKHFEKGNGPKGKHIVIYEPSEVRQWKARQRVREAA